jgi:riboflavin biosynthesis pyrimidine reductase
MLMAGPQSQPAAATQLTLLGSARRVHDDELSELYAYPAAGIWVRANFIASLDGAAAVDGTTRALGGPVDRALFNLLRALADVVLVGAGTVRMENYSGARPTVTQRQHRAARGQSEVPPLAIVTKSGHLDRDMPVFTNTEVAPLVLTCTAAAAATRRRLAGIADVVDCSGADPGRVEETALLNALTERGLRRVLTEGGPTVLSSFIERGVLDELCLTIAPCLVGGTAPRIAAGPGQLLTRMSCAHILADDDGYLYTRYVKAD